MGYDIHITRREDWWDEGGPGIATHEWEAVVESDADLSMIPPPSEWSGPSQWSAVMTTHPDEERFGTALHWASGEIRAKNPSDILIAKMRQVAKALNARVQGDDGEYYDE
ncbi:hypothetical protein, partial [Streptomyces antibioticus]|uniref:Uncharacterized protein n=1 Tax=Streptomyces antibioticus TaxID=1890 RepID=A0AAE7CNU8_STRAT